MPRFRKVGFKRRNLQEEILQNRAVSGNDLAHVLTWIDYVRSLTAHWPLLPVFSAICSTPHLTTGSDRRHALASAAS